MKLNKFFLAGLLVLPLLVACSETTFTPSHVYPSNDPLNPEASANPSNSGQGSEGESGQSEDEEEVEENMTVYFYVNYSNSDTPKYRMRWTMLKPLGACPEQAKLTNADAPDPLYPKFLGYSEYPSLIDAEGDNADKMWDFAKDYKQSNVLNLYGIWVSE